MSTRPTARRLDKKTEEQNDIERGRARAGELKPLLLSWYRKHRRDLPWRRTKDPYAIWLSEVMLQQTRVETVLPYYDRFLRTFPTVSSLSEAPLDDVLTLWAGLGYYRRARMLHAAAKEVHEQHGGALPASVEGLRSVHGIGPYTAGAVASIAFGLPAALVDGNVARVISRLFALDDDMRKPAGMARVWRIAEGLVAGNVGEAPGEAGDWNQGLMELGATICVPRSPRCLLCPLSESCEARKQGLEQELPVMSKKTEPTLERRLALVATRGDEVLLAQRCTNIRFGGMWEPPSLALAGEPAPPKTRGWKKAGAATNVSTLTAADPATLKALGQAPLADVEHAGDLVHVLSHRRLEVSVHTAHLTKAPPTTPPTDEYDHCRLVAQADLGSYALTSLARKILAVARIA